MIFSFFRHPCRVKSLQIALFALLTVGPNQVTFAEFIAGYRVLHSSPQEINSALFSPLPQKQNSGNIPRQTSRLEKYFRIKSKTIRSPSVILEVLPLIPVIESSIPSTDPIKITTTQVSAVANSYIFSAKIELTSKKFFDTKIQIEPHDSGSMVTLSMDKSNLSPSLIKTFVFTAKQLGFLFDSKAAAQSHDALIDKK